MQKYGTDLKLDELVNSNLWVDRLEAAKQGYALDVLVKDNTCYVREAVANYYYF